MMSKKTQELVFDRAKNIIVTRCLIGTLLKGYPA